MSGAILKRSRHAICNFMMSASRTLQGICDSWNTITKKLKCYFSHFLGHVLGLNDSLNKDDIMVYKMNNQGQKVELSSNDVFNIQKIYGMIILFTFLSIYLLSRCLF